MVQPQSFCAERRGLARCASTAGTSQGLQVAGQSSRAVIDTAVELQRIRFACRRVEKGEPYWIHRATIEGALDRLAAALSEGTTGG